MVKMMSIYSLHMVNLVLRTLGLFSKTYKISCFINLHHQYVCISVLLTCIKDCFNNNNNNIEQQGP